MNKFFAIISLIRVRQWIKNSFVAIPFILSFKFIDFSSENYLNFFIGILSFCLMSSAMYIVNDFRDIGEDKNHARKKKRPLASGEISALLAMVLFFILFSASVILTHLYFNNYALLLILLYCANSLIYTFLLKNYAIFDVISIALGFVLRVLFGIFCFGAPISKWVILLTFTLCLFLAFTKRRKDFLTDGYVKKSLQGYNLIMLDKFITISSVLTISSYIMYSTEMLNITDNYGFIFTDLFVIFGIFRYLQSMHLDKVDVGDSGIIIYKDMVFLVNLILWALSLILSLSYTYISYLS